MLIWITAENLQVAKYNIILFIVVVNMWVLLRIMNHKCTYKTCRYDYKAFNKSRLSISSLFGAYHLPAGLYDGSASKMSPKFRSKSERKLWILVIDVFDIA